MDWSKSEVENSCSWWICGKHKVANWFKIHCIGVDGDHLAGSETRIVVFEGKDGDVHTVLSWDASLLPSESCVFQPWSSINDGHCLLALTKSAKHMSNIVNRRCNRDVCRCLKESSFQSSLLIWGIERFVQYSLKGGFGISGPLEEISCKAQVYVNVEPRVLLQASPWLKRSARLVRDIEWLLDQEE